jgi:CheY-like chemotaxis protein
MPHLPFGDSRKDAAAQPSNSDRLARVLLVDDDETDILLARRLLFDRKGLNCAFEFARSSEEAMRRLISGYETGRRFDLVLLDVTMPGADGYSLLRRLRDNVALRATPVIMCTGSGAETHRSEAFYHGVIGYMTKPPTMQKLRPILENLPTLDVFDQGGDHSLLHIA